MGSINGCRARCSSSMAGWSMVADNNDDEDVVVTVVDRCNKTPNPKNNLESNRSPDSKGPAFEKRIKELVSMFRRLLESFLDEFCSMGIFRPLPPMTGDGKPVDLCNLFMNVSHKGGFDAVSENGSSWDEVAQETGLGFDNSASAKLIYVKYLDALARWLNRVIAGDSDGTSVELSGISDDLVNRLKDFLSEVKRKYELRKGKAAKDVGAELKWFISKTKRRYDKVSGSSNVVKEIQESETTENEKKKKNVEIVIEDDVVKEIQESETTEIEKKKKNVEIVIEDDVVKEIQELETTEIEKKKNVEIVIEDDVAKEIQESETSEKVIECTELSDNNNNKNECSYSLGKRKRECSLETTLNWLSDVAKDPCDPSLGSLPERSKWWEAYGSEEEPWKQLLLFRASRTTTDSACEKTWQKIQKMHPSLYDDSGGPTYNLRERLSFDVNDKKAEKGKKKSSSSSGNGSDSASLNSSDEEEDRPCALIGPEFQAEVPEWNGIMTPDESSDLKWLGTRIWPLSKEQHNNNHVHLIERDPIGKGRNDPCGCQNPGSIECVKFHISTKQEKLKLELGPAFYMWCFDVMGEGTLQYWSILEQKKFKALMTTPPTLSASFFDDIKKVLGYKSRGKIVSYFYNVTLLQFRASQSRINPNEIDSDTDELYYIATTANEELLTAEAQKKPVLLSPKKKRRR